MDGSILGRVKTPSSPPKSSRPARSDTRSPTQLVTASLYVEVKRPGPETEQASSKLGIAEIPYTH